MSGPRYIWTAEDAAGIGHANRAGHVLTLCGRRSRDPRWSWPVRTHCADCEALTIWPVPVVRVPIQNIPPTALSSGWPTAVGTPSSERKLT